MCDGKEYINIDILYTLYHSLSRMVVVTTRLINNTVPSMTMMMTIIITEKTTCLHDDKCDNNVQNE